MFALNARGRSFEELGELFSFKHFDSFSNQDEFKLKLMSAIICRRMTS